MTAYADAIAKPPRMLTELRDPRPKAARIDDVAVEHKGRLIAAAPAEHSISGRRECAVAYVHFPQAIALQMVPKRNQAGPTSHLHLRGRKPSRSGVATLKVATDDHDGGIGPIINGHFGAGPSYERRKPVAAGLGIMLRPQ